MCSRYTEQSLLVTFTVTPVVNHATGASSSALGMAVTAETGP
jgi:hypothetical protein